MNSPPRVTVVLAAYNAEQFIDAAVKSIRDQTFTDLELIVINDRSTDGTLGKLERHSTEDPRVIVLNNETNIRQVASLNRGILQARGAYIAIMDADDISVNTRIEEQVTYLDKHPEVGVVGCLTDAFVNDPSDARPSGSRADGSWLDGNIMMAHPTMMVRRELYDLYGLYEPRHDIIGDYEIQSRFGHNGVVMHVIDKILLHYRVHPSAMTSTRRKEQVSAALYISLRTMFRYRRSLSRRGYKAFLRYALIWTYMTLRLEKIIPRSIGKKLSPSF